MEKQSRGKTEMQSGRRLQEKRDASRRQKCHRTETCMSFSGWWANGLDMALAHSMRGWGPLEAADFGNSDAVWPPGTQHGHQHWGQLSKSLAGGKDGRRGLFPAT